MIVDLIEEHVSAWFIKGYIAQFITDDQVIFFKPQLQCPQGSGGMAFPDLHQHFWDRGKQDAFPLLTYFDAQSNSDMRFTSSWISIQDNIMSRINKV